MTRPDTQPAYRILVIDDTPTIHEDFRKILRPPVPATTGVDELAAELFGEPVRRSPRPVFEVDSATQGQEGLAMLVAARNSGRPYALAFVDMRMPPGWDGIETIKHLWTEDPALQVVICTAYSDAGWDEMLRRLGDPDGLVVLKKPFDTIEALQLARAMTNRWELQRVRG